MKTALIGIGLMGQALGERLIEKNIVLTVYNRTQEKTNSLKHLGAHVAESAQDAFGNNEVIILMLSDATAINHIVDTLSASSVEGKLIIQMGTIAPEQSHQIAMRIQTMKGNYLECPVLGSLPEARTGRLILMAGGNQTDFENAKPLLELLGEQPRLIGTIGQGATVKLAMNQLIAGLTASFSLSLALVEKNGLDIETFMAIVRESALYAPTFDKKLDRMLQQDYSNPNFPTKHLAKDVTLFLDVARRMGLETCALEGVGHLITKTVEQGLDNTDYSALYSGIIN
jgi:3-hydroxyisobutyrate dehydrogenase